jgi:hypothetical protein
MRRVESITKAQEQTLTALKTLLGELGYDFCSPAAYRYSQWDFLAYEKESCRQFLIIRPMNSGCIKIYCFLRKIHYNGVPQLLEQHKNNFEARVCWAQREARTLKGIGGWARYFPKEIRPVDAD